MVAAADQMSPHAIAYLGSDPTVWSAKDDLERITAPTLIVNGRWEKDFQTALPHARQAMPHLDIVDLEGGHSINVERPEAFDEALLSFIDRVR